MSGISKIACSVFLLLLFLFPQVQKGWHDFEHRHDTHCDASAEVHLHQLEHVCVFCDLSLAVGLELSFINQDIFLDEISTLISEFIYTNLPAIVWQSIPPRAPPVFFS